MSGGRNVDAPSAFVDEAYRLESEADIVAFYDKWADDYDRQMLDELGYLSPTRSAEGLATRLADRDAEILDIGCGTGLACAPLAARGYRRLDGLDLSPAMIRVCAGRGIYRELFVADVNRPLGFADASYDGVVSSGTFTHGHVGPEPLDEIFRVLRPGGLLCCTVHGDLWEAHGFRRRLERLVAAGTAECLSRELGPYYRGREPEGWFCVYRRRA